MAILDRQWRGKGNLDAFQSGDYGNIWYTEEFGWEGPKIRSKLSKNEKIL